jgi:hypothetical protein
MSRARLDLTGRQIGDLTVIGPAPTIKGNVHWECACSCGRTCTKAKANLHPIQKVFNCGKCDYLPYDQWAEFTRNVYGLLKPFVYMTKALQHPDLPPQPPHWACVCLGGCHSFFVKATADALRKGRVYSCDKPSCIAKGRKLMEADEAIKHARQRDLTYNSYRGMIDRVNNNPEYRHVKVDKRWQGEGGFDRFIEDMGLRPHEDLSIERIDPYGDYVPANCHWADDKEQSKNKRNSVRFTIDGETINLCDVADKLGTTSQAVTRRMAALVEDGMSKDEAATKLLANGRKPAQCAVAA